MRYTWIILISSLAIAACRPTPPPTPPVQERLVTIIGMNDWHGALYETPDPEAPGWAYGGLPWTVSSLQYLRDALPNALVVDAGDLFQGSWPINFSKGSGSLSAFELLGVDVSTVGNHEFDYGPLSDDFPGVRGALERAAINPPFEWVTANVFERSKPKGEWKRWQPGKIRPWTLIDHHGVRVGVIGLSTTETPTTTRSAYVDGLEFRDVVETLREVVPQAREAGAEVIVVTGHLTGSCEPPGYAKEEVGCVPDGEIGRILTELPEGTVDVLVAGHEHTILRQRVGKTVVLEGRHKGHLLNAVTLHLNDEGIVHEKTRLHEPFVVRHLRSDPGCSDTSYPERLEVNGVVLQPSKEAIALIQSLENKAGSLCERIACLDSPYTTIRTGPSPLGTLVAQAMRAQFPSVDIAITNAGGLRASLMGPEVRREHIHDVMPFDNRLLLMEISGKKLRQLFEIGTSGAHGMLQIDGATLTLHRSNVKRRDLNRDGNKEDWESSKLCDARVNGKTIDPRKTYRIVTTDFLATGGDHLGTAFEEAILIEEGLMLRDAILEHLRSAEGCFPPPGEDFPIRQSARCRVR